MLTEKHLEELRAERRADYLAEEARDNRTEADRKTAEDLEARDLWRAFLALEI